MPKNFTLKWEDKGTSFPLKASLSVDRGRGYSGRLICNSCGSELKQYYICQNCGRKHTIGQVEKRKEKETGIIYNPKKKKKFVEKEVKGEMRVIDEIKLADIFPSFAEFLNTGKIYELYNNDNPEYYKTLREYVSLKSSALVVEYGYYGKIRKGLVVPSFKLLLIPIRDNRLIRATKQKELEAEKNPLRDKLKKLSKDRSIDRERKFFEKKRKGKKIDIQVKKKKEIEAKLGDLKGELEKMRGKREKAKA